MIDGSTETIREPARDIRVAREAEVLVVGGGPAGIGAAVAAARNGADTVLVERYNHLGGMLARGLDTASQIVTQGVWLPPTVPLKEDDKWTTTPVHPLRARSQR